MAIPRQRRQKLDARGLQHALRFTSQGISRGLQSPPGSVPDRCSIVKWQVPGD